MKKFVLKVLLFFACIVVMDLAFGLLFSYLRAHAKGGSTANCEYIANRCQDDIIILGSSRATHHYIPQIIEDSLGMSCYNCGEEGNGIVLAFGRLSMLLERYSPKLILYEITPGYDYGTNDLDSKYLGYLRPYYKKKGISRIFDDFDDDLSFLKMKSSMYQNTSRVLPDLLDNIVYRDNRKGFEPLYGRLDTTDIRINNNYTFGDIDSLKLSYLKQLIVETKCRGIPVIFMISPRYCKYIDLSSYEPALALCASYNVPVYNFINYKSISDNEVYFQDLGHMNSDGATAYTQLLIKDVLKTVLQ